MSPKKKQVKPIKRNNREKERMTKSRKGGKKKQEKEGRFLKGSRLEKYLN